MGFPGDFMEVDNGDDFVGEKEFNFLVTKPRKSKRRLDYPLVIIEQILSDNNNDNDNDEDDDMDDIEDDLGQNVSFDAPESGYEDDSDTININIKQSFAWIVYWILKYQERYRLSDTTTNSLIKFVRHILISYDKKTYSTFPTTLYMARKLFGIGDQIIKYATC